VSESSRLRVGLLGCGRIADLHAAGYRGHPRAEIVAVCDTDAEVARGRAAQWGASRWYTNASDLLSDATVDAVEVLTPHHLHAEHAIAALEAGKHVSLQKPPARSLAEYERIAAAAARTDKVFRVFENFMHYPPHAKAKEVIDSGAIGTPLSVRLKTAGGRPDAGWSIEPSSLAWRTNIEACGGGATTFDHGYHCFHMARFFIDAEIERVHAFIHWTRFGDNAWYDGPALISWRYAGEPPRMGSWEVIASMGLRVRSKYYVSDDRIEVHGTEGIVWVNRCTGKLLEEPAVVLYREGETRAFHDLEVDWAASFRRGTEDFVDAVLTGRKPALTVEDARETLRLALAAQRSAAEGREIVVAELDEQSSRV
jgi:predicted dehydrogenase